MILKVISSSSKGNCYLLIADNGETLVIECGVKFSEIKKALDFDLSKVVGCIQSHEHLDHSLSYFDLLKYGIPVYALSETHKNCFKAIDFTHNCFDITVNNPVSIGTFKVIPFPVFHDVPAIGFYINHPECGNVLFATDTTHIEGKFNNLNNIIIEANYDRTEMELHKFYSTGKDYSFLTDRIINSHMSIETCYEFLAHQDLSAVNNIVLIHLSDRNSDANAFQERITKLTGKTVTIADSGKELQFNKTPF